MPIIRPFRSRKGLYLAAALLAEGLMSSVNGAAPAAVRVIRSVPWSPGDLSREGAGEFSVLIHIAQVQQSGGRAGLLGVGAPHGVFAPGPERALRFAVLSGVPVVKLAPGGDVASCPDELFVNAGTLTEVEAQRVLAAALEASGAPPRARDPGHPTTTELDGIRRYVRQLQQHFAFARPGLVAGN